jgi:hypothetical protein
VSKEQPVDIVEHIRQKMKEGGGSSNMPPELFFVPKDGKKRIRFLSEFNEAIEVVMHGKYGVMMPQPCLEYYGMECPFHGRKWNTTTQYAWTVYDYESKQKKVFMSTLTQYSAMDDLMAIWDESKDKFGNKTIKDRDIVIRRSGGDKAAYRARDKGPSEFDGEFSKPFSEKKVRAILQGLIAFKTEPKDDDDDEDDAKPRGAKPKDDDEDDAKPKAAAAKKREEDEED